VSRGDDFDVRSLCVTYRHGHELPLHTHPWAQLIYAASGLVHVMAEGLLWITPPTRAVFIPAGVAHELRFRGEAKLRTLYLRANALGTSPRALGCLEVDGLLRELILHVTQIGMLSPAVPTEARLRDVLVDRIQVAPSLDLLLPVPVDPRAQRLADAIHRDPASKRTLADRARESGASVRTLQRLFLDQTGLPLDTWRQKARMIHAAGALAAGRSVTEAALDCGYESTSAFIQAFRKQFGMTPGQFRESSMKTGVTSGRDRR